MILTIVIMSFIALLGCDGSGKSAVIHQVSERLRAEGIQVACGHWRPKAFFSDTAHGVGVVFDNPHGKAPRGQVVSLMKLAWLWLNWWMGWWRGMRKLSHHGVVLFDRFHGDLLVDPQRYRYGGSLMLARIAVRLMPQPDMILFLDAAPEILLSRKQEVSRESLEQSRHRYVEMGKRYACFRIIDVNQPLECVVDEVMARIMDQLMMVNSVKQNADVQAIS